MFERMSDKKAYSISNFLIYKIQHETTRLGCGKTQHELMNVAKSPVIKQEFSGELADISPQNFQRISLRIQSKLYENIKKKYSRLSKKKIDISSRGFWQV